MSTEVLESANNALKKRLDDPILGTYVIAFAIWNWKIFFLTFDNQSIPVKIKILEEFLYPLIIWDKGHGLLAFLKAPFVSPILITGLYLWLFPKIFKRLYTYVEDTRVDRMNQKHDAEDRLRPNQKKIKALSDQLASEIQSHQQTKELNQANEQLIESQKKNIASLDAEILNYKPRKNAEKKPAPVLPLINVQKEKQRAVLKARNIDIDVHLDLREYKEKHKQTMEQTLALYASIVALLMDPIFKENSQSATVKKVKVPFFEALSMQDYEKAGSIIEDLPDLALFTADEKTALEIVFDILEQLQKYTQ